MNRSLLLLLLAAPAFGQHRARLVADRDNTLYESDDGSVSNALGEAVFAGITGTGARRAAVLRFDLDAIPAGARVTSASVRLDVFGLEVEGYGETYVYEVGDDSRLLADVRRIGQWIPLDGVQLEMDEDEVEVDGDRARARGTVFLVEGDRRYGQPFQARLERTGGRWFVTAVRVRPPTARPGAGW